MVSEVGSHYPINRKSERNTKDREVKLIALLPPLITQEYMENVICPPAEQTNLRK